MYQPSALFQGQFFFFFNLVFPLNKKDFLVSFYTLWFFLKTGHLKTIIWRLLKSDSPLSPGCAAFCYLFVFWLSLCQQSAWGYKLKVFSGLLCLSLDMCGHFVTFPIYVIAVYMCIDYAKAFDCVDHNKLWKILKEMEMEYHSISERDGNTRPPDLPLEKPVCRSGSNS